eukprot:TRINITY_DN3502_c0_g1_i6.p1 TRINITY_DN3502_c0_g1~~TRINITY_DN3502_c0_g1_i6.p1  ORF type:complete len:775 (-),score=167.67 TRINITY_DN3502_c0_g1_i6:197-2521(-)
MCIRDRSHDHASSPDDNNKATEEITATQQVDPATIAAREEALKQRESELDERDRQLAELELKLKKTSQENEVAHTREGAVLEDRRQQVEEALAALEKREFVAAAHEQELQERDHECTSRSDAASAQEQRLKRTEEELSHKFNFDERALREAQTSRAESLVLVSALTARVDRLKADLGRERARNVDALTSLQGAKSSVSDGQDRNRALEDKLKAQTSVITKLSCDVADARLKLQVASAAPQATPSSDNDMYSGSTISNEELLRRVDGLMENIRLLRDQNFDLMMELDDPEYSRQLHEEMGTLRAENRRLQKRVDYYNVPSVVAGDIVADEGTGPRMYNTTTIGTMTMPVSESTQYVPATQTAVDRHLNTIDRLQTENVNLRLTVEELLGKEAHHITALATEDPVSDTHALEARVAELEAEIRLLGQNKGYSDTPVPPVLVQKETSEITTQTEGEEGPKPRRPQSFRLSMVRAAACLTADEEGARISEVHALVDNLKAGSPALTLLLEEEAAIAEELVADDDGKPIDPTLWVRNDSDSQFEALVLFKDEVHALRRALDESRKDVAVSRGIEATSISVSQEATRSASVAGKKLELAESENARLRELLVIESVSGTATAAILDQMDEASPTPNRPHLTANPEVVAALKAEIGQQRVERDNLLVELERSETATATATDVASKLQSRLDCATFQLSRTEKMLVDIRTTYHKAEILLRRMQKRNIEANMMLKVEVDRSEALLQMGFGNGLAPTSDEDAPLSSSYSKAVLDVTTDLEDVSDD